MARSRLLRCIARSKSRARCALSDMFAVTDRPLVSCVAAAACSARVLPHPSSELEVSKSSALFQRAAALLDAELAGLQPHEMELDRLGNGRLFVPASRTMC